VCLTGAGKLSGLAQNGPLKQLMYVECKMNHLKIVGSIVFSTPVLIHIINILREIRVLHVQLSLAQRKIGYNLVTFWRGQKELQFLVCQAV